MVSYNHRNKKTTTKQEETDMRVTGISELAEIIENNNRIEKAEKEIKKNRIKELVAEGIDRELAKVMVEAGLACGVQM